MTGPGSACAWCRGVIPAGKRRDAETCSKSCRQARHRFASSVGAPGAVVAGQPRRLAYADPPYPGKSRRYYGDHPDYAGEVDHAELIESLTAEFDAWALSTSAAALRDVLLLCPPGARVAAWVRGGRVNRDARSPLSSWEPVIYGGQILREPSHRTSATRRDRLEVDASDQLGATRRADPLDASRPAGGERRLDSLVLGVTARRTDPRHVTGAKPAGFARWVFQLLDAQPGDTLVDVFPGSGGIARAWDSYTSPAAAVRRDGSLEEVPA